MKITVSDFLAPCRCFKPERAELGVTVNPANRITEYGVHCLECRSVVCVPEGRIDFVFELATPEPRP